jgi:hypothetical protein
MAGIRCQSAMIGALSTGGLATSMTITDATMILSAIGSRNMPSRDTVPCARAR